MKIVQVKGSFFECHCGCKQSYLQAGWLRHYKDTIWQRSLDRWKNSSDNSALVRDVDDLRNLDREVYYER